MRCRAFGHFDGKTHILPIRVYYEDTDLSGVVYHANYLRYMERGRTEFFRCAGITGWPYSTMPNRLPGRCARRTLEFHRPARLDDLLEVHTTLRRAHRRAHDGGSEDLLRTARC